MYYHKIQSSEFFFTGKGGDITDRKKGVYGFMGTDNGW